MQEIRVQKDGLFGLFLDALVDLGIPYKVVIDGIYATIGVSMPYTILFTGDMVKFGDSLIDVDVATGRTPIWDKDEVDEKELKRPVSKKFYKEYEIFNVKRYFSVLRFILDPDGEIIYFKML